MKTIAELWNGRLEPARDLGKSNEEIKQLEELIEHHGKKLENIFKGREKETFEKFNCCMEEYLCLICEQAFCVGFSIGAKITAEALVEDL